MGGYDFGARFYQDAMARFYSPDWSATVEPVPYAKLDNPQTLNLYTYAANNPMTFRDPDGHDLDAPEGGGDPAQVSSSQPGSTSNAPGAAQAAASTAAAGSVAVPYPGAPAADAAAGSSVGESLSAIGTALVEFAEAAAVPVLVVTYLVDPGSGGGNDSNDTIKMSGPKAADAPGVTAGGQATDQYGNKLGPSGDAQVNKTKSTTREGARNKALAEGSGVVEHKRDQRTGPHFHPTDANGTKKPSSTHHEYPE